MPEEKSEEGKPEVDLSEAGIAEQAGAAQTQQEEAPNQEAPHRLSSTQSLLVTAGLMLGISLAALDLLIIATAVNDISTDLGDLSSAAWVFTSYLLGHTVAVMIWGKLGDLFGRGRAFTFAVLGFMAASMLAGASQSMLMLVIARLLQGLAAGGLVALSNAIIGDFVPVRKRGTYMAVLTSVWTIAALLGPLLGGVLVDTVGWRWIFYMNLPWGAVAILLVSPVRKFPAPDRQPVIDYRGAVLLIMGLGLVSGAAFAAESGSDGWDLPLIGSISGWGLMAVLLAAGLAGLAVFAWTQLRAAEPVVPLSMFGNRVVRVASIATFLFGMANFGSAILIPLYAQLVTGVSPTEAGYSLTPVPVGILVSATVVGWLIRRTGQYRFYPALGGLIFAFGVFLLITMNPDTPRLTAMAFAFIAGLGNGMIQPVVTIAIQNSVPYSNLGAGTALAISTRSFGQTIGSAIIGAVLAARISAELVGVNLGGITSSQLEDDPDLAETLSEPAQAAVVGAYHAAFDVAFWIMVAFSLLSAAVAFALPGRKLEDGG